MILLFEDRLGRQHYYHPTPLPKNVLHCVFDFEGDIAQVGAHLSASFLNPITVLFHKSYQPEKAGRYLSAIKDFYLGSRIPFAFFSDGMDIGNVSTVSNTAFATLSARQLYQHLDAFAKSTHIDIRLLALGPNYILDEFLRFLQHVNALFFSHSKNHQLTEDERFDMQDLIRRFQYESNPLSVIYQKLFQWLDPKQSHDITLSLLIQQLQKAQNEIKKSYL